MAGNLYRAIQRTGGLQPVINAMNDIYEKKKMAEYYEGLNKEVNTMMTKMNEYKDPNYGKTQMTPEQMDSVNQVSNSVAGVPALFERKPTDILPSTPAMSKAEKYNQAQSDYLEFMRKNYNPEMGEKGLQALNTQGAFIGGQANLFKPKEGYDEFKEGTRYVHRDTGKEIYHPEEKQTKPTEKLLKRYERGGYDVAEYGTDENNITRIQSLPLKDYSGINARNSGSGGRGEDANVGEFTQIAKYMEEAKNLSNNIKAYDRVYKNEKKDGKYFTHEQELKGGGTKKIYGSQEEIENTKKDNFKTLQAMHDKIDLEISEQIPDYKVMKPEIWQWIKKGEKTYKENNKIEKLTSEDKRTIAKSIINEYVNGQTKKLGLLPSQDAILKSILIDQFEQMYY
jgi:hypothetical protein